MKLKEVLKIIPDAPVKIWSPETELSDTIEPCGLPLIVAWDEEIGETIDICTISPELSLETSKTLSRYLVHCYNKFEGVVKEFRNFINALPEEHDDLHTKNLIERAERVLDDAEKVKI